MPPKPVLDIQYILKFLMCFSLIGAFLKMLMCRLHNLLKMHEENTLLPDQWVVREAANQDALQEAGTFRYRKKRKIIPDANIFFSLHIKELGPLLGCFCCLYPPWGNLPSLSGDQLKAKQIL